MSSSHRFNMEKMVPIVGAQHCKQAIDPILVLSPRSDISLIQSSQLKPYILEVFCSRLVALNVAGKKNNRTNNKL